MYCLGNHFFTGTRFSGDRDGDVGLRSFFDHREHFLYLFALPDDHLREIVFAADLALQGLHFLFQIAYLPEVEDTVPETILGIIILYNVVEGAVLEEVDGGSDVFLARNDDDPDIRVMFLDLFENFGPITIRERIVERYHVRVLMQLSEKISGRFESFDLVFGVESEVVLEHRAIPDIIFYDKDRSEE